MNRFWTCQRQTKGVKCGRVNPARRHICLACGKRRAPRKKPKHMQVLGTTTYEECVKMFGEVCGICGIAPKPGKKLHRDHEHKGTGKIRGLLCFRCNTALSNRLDVVWLEKAIAYLRRAEA